MSRLMSRNLQFYLAILLVFGAGIWLILDRGSHLQTAAPVAAGEVAPPIGQPAVIGELGALMSTQGLIELIVLNIGFDLRRAALTSP